MGNKTGAGYFFVSNGFGLLTKRTSRHNDKTWDISGGNVDPTDEDLAATALREAAEELGHVPESFKIVSSVPLRRGKHGQKQFTVFVAQVPEDVADRYEPSLDLSEHTDWHWFKLDGLIELHDYQRRHGVPKLPEHPGEHEEQPQAESGGDPDNKKKHHKKHRDPRESGQQYIKGDVVLHPWAYLLFEQPTRERWYSKVSSTQGEQGTHDEGGEHSSDVQPKQQVRNVQEHEKDGLVEGGLGGSYVKVEDRHPKVSATRRAEQGSYCSIS